MGFREQELSRNLTELRADGSEEALERGAALEREYEKDLAKNASDDELIAKGYTPDELRKAHKPAARKSSTPKKNGS